MKKSSIIIIAIFALYVALPCIAHATPPDPGGDPDTGVPLDGGLGILVAAGIGFAAKKIRDTKNYNKAK